MGKAGKKSSTSEQAAESASDSEEIIPVVKLETFGLNKQGQFVKKTSYLGQIPEPSKQPKQSRQAKTPAQEEALRRVREAYPDGVGSRSSYAVHKRISGEGYNPSLDSVHRALGRERKK